VIDRSRDPVRQGEADQDGAQGERAKERDQNQTDGIQ
jgi:hypothetical protein